MRKDPIQIRPITGRDRDAVARFIDAEWGGPVAVAHGTVFRPAELPGFLAQQVNGSLAGLLTYVVAGGALEIITLNAVARQAGTGTALVDHAVAEARRRGCLQVTLSTTNDNLDALRFYQRRGFRLTALRPGAVAESRKIKPQIPEIGDHGIPVCDELDLARPV